MFRRAFENNPDFMDLNIQFATQYIPEDARNPMELQMLCTSV